MQRAHHTAFQARLRAAITEAGIDRDLGFRHLTSLRSVALPGGKVTEELVQRLHDRGGQIRDLTAADAAALYAIHTLMKDPPEGFHDWVRARQPLRGLVALKEMNEWVDAAMGVQSASPVTATPASEPERPLEPALAPRTVATVAPGAAVAKAVAKAGGGASSSVRSSPTCSRWRRSCVSRHRTWSRSRGATSSRSKWASCFKPR